MSQKMAKMAMLTKNKQKIFIYDDNQCVDDNDGTEHKKVGEKCLQKMANYICQICNYYTHKKYNYDIHLSSIKHIENVNSMNNNKHYEYKCDVCDYNTNKKYNYEKHILSIKHKHKYNKNEKIKSKELENENVNNTNVNNKNNIITSINDDTISSIMSEIKVLMVEQNKMNKMITEIANKPTNITNNNNTQTNNQQFNMNVFLNETCKDAMNMSEFIENLQVSMEDMEKTGELGFAKGMSRIIMNNLNAIDFCKRPIHCSDVKRETLYVKNNGVWEKETEDRKKTKEVIYRISSLNVKQLLRWRDLPRNKGYEKSDHKKNDEFTKLVMEINKLREEEIDKVITNISKHVAIDKNKVKMSGYLN